jgi:hypothetical protein
MHFNLTALSNATYSQILAYLKLFNIIENSPIFIAILQLNGFFNNTSFGFFDNYMFLCFNLNFII